MIFNTDWYAETNQLLNDSINETNKTSRGPSFVQVVPSGPSYSNDNNHKLFTSLIHMANSQITIVNPYFVPDDALVTAITSAAQRNVDVTIINSEIMDQKLVGFAQRSYYEELLSAGVKIYWYKSPVLLHSKTITIDDDVAVIGSSNFDMRSFQLNLEITVMIYDQATNKQMRQIESQYISKSKLITINRWQNRPLKFKLLETLARLSAALQ